MKHVYHHIIKSLLFLFGWDICSKAVWIVSNFGNETHLGQTGAHTILSVGNQDPKMEIFFASKAIELRDEWWNLGLTYGYMVGTSNLGTHHDGTTHQDLWDDYEEKGVFHTDYQTWQSNMACWKIPGSGFFLLFSCPFRSVISRCPGEYFQPYPYPLANKGRI